MTIVFRSSCFVLLLVLVTGGSALAENRSALQPGTRIRATYIEHYRGWTRSRQITGDFAKLSDCTLALIGRAGDDLTFLPRENITRVERSVSPSHRTKAIWGGGVVGAGVGIVTTISWTSGNSSQWRKYNDTYLAWIGVCSFAGMVLGGLFGLVFTQGEKWREVDLHSVALSFAAPAGSEGGLQLRIRF